MATKLKGEVIKAGSIAYDALSDDVKNKIENSASGADWGEVYSSAVTNTTVQITNFYASTVLNLKYNSFENKVYYKGLNTLEWAELGIWILGVTLGNVISSGALLTSVNMVVANEVEGEVHSINDFKIYAETNGAPTLTWNYNGKKYTWHAPENISIEEIFNDVYVLPFTRDDVEMAFNETPNVPMPFDSIEELKQAVAKNKLI